ncbi:hypothetical protein VKS41_006967 [Umbelopsis sp. WA50703]
MTAISLTVGLPLASPDVRQMKRVSEATPESHLLDRNIEKRTSSVHKKRQYEGVGGEDMDVAGMVGTDAGEAGGMIVDDIGEGLGTAAGDLEELKKRQHEYLSPGPDSEVDAIDQDQASDLLNDVLRKRDMLTEAENYLNSLAEAAAPAPPAPEYDVPEEVDQ